MKLTSVTLTAVTVLVLLACVSPAQATLITFELTVISESNQAWCDSHGYNYCNGGIAPHREWVNPPASGPIVIDDSLIGHQLSGYIFNPYSGFDPRLFPVYDGLRPLGLGLVDNSFTSVSLTFFEQDDVWRIRGSVDPNGGDFFSLGIPNWALNQACSSGRERFLDPAPFCRPATLDTWASLGGSGPDSLWAGVGTYHADASRG